MSRRLDALLKRIYYYPTAFETVTGQWVEHYSGTVLIRCRKKSRVISFTSIAFILDRHEM